MCQKEPNVSRRVNKACVEKWPQRAPSGSSECLGTWRAQLGLNDCSVQSKQGELTDRTVLLDANDTQCIIQSIVCENKKKKHHVYVLPARQRDALYHFSAAFQEFYYEKVDNYSDS